LTVNRMNIIIFRIGIQKSESHQYDSFFM